MWIELDSMCTVHDRLKCNCCLPGGTRGVPDAHGWTHVVPGMGELKEADPVLSRAACSAFSPESRRISIVFLKVTDKAGKGFV